MTVETQKYPLINHIAAWSVHLFTASAAAFGVLSLLMIYRHEYVLGLLFMAVTVFIDAVDGSFARLVEVKSVLPNIDGALLDNIVDYLNYVITPCFFLLVKPGMLPEGYAIPLIVAITITSAYQFCQSDAKTPDHFFKGFPCYWNIAVFYMFILNSSMTCNALILSVLCVLIFVPIKYVYPSRLDFFTSSKPIKILMHCCSGIFGLSTLIMLLEYPVIHPLWLALSVAYILLYLALSLYRNYCPMNQTP